MTRSIALLVVAACGGGNAPPELPAIVIDTAIDSTTSTGSTSSDLAEVSLTVTLDGQPTEGIEVRQGGAHSPLWTDANGQAMVMLDPTIPGDVALVASHPEARTRAVVVGGPTATIELHRFSLLDNEAYAFGDPGSPDDNADTGKCAHCHETIVEDWYSSAHRQAASNPWVQRVYAGVSDHSDATACVEAGGQWWTGLEPGTGTALDRCYLGSGTLPDLNPDCGSDASCDGVATQTGACADCHAPGINGQVGGRDLLEASGIAFEDGVHCDVCHRVEGVDLTAPAGVAGRLRLLRPSEPGNVETWEPLTFGPLGDVPNIRMGSVRRDHFKDPSFCAGCHQLDQAALVPGLALDPTRWPAGVLPVHSTYEEWLEGPFSPGAPCTSCHMPPNPVVGNAADLYVLTNQPGIAAGWPRPAGTVRHHTWVGPRTPGENMLQLAATVDVVTREENGTLWVDATVTNVGPGHALPTGEPLRHMILLVDAECAGTPLAPTGGDVVPDFGASLAHQDATGDWTVWPGAAVGEQIRVVRTTGDWHDYTGHGPFGDGRFDAVAKGLPVTEWVGAATIVSVKGDVVTTDVPLPAGTDAYRIAPADWPLDGLASGDWAGHPGFGFARVLTDSNGNRMVPHHAAVDVVSDNRLLPQQAWTSSHAFDQAGCAAPVARASLLYRPIPLALARERDVPSTDRVMAEVTR